jgi:lysophospholipase L1-like esterase
MKILIKVGQSCRFAPFLASASEATVTPLRETNASPQNQLGRRGNAALPVLIGAMLFLLTVAGFSADPNALAKLQNVHRIVFLGDSITYAGGYVDDVETYYVTRFPEQHFEFINVGLSSETVSGLSEASEKNPRPDLHERLGRVLEKTKPDLVFICYGMNDGIYSPPDEARLKAFQDGMKSVHEQIATSQVKIIHVTPPVFDPIKGRAVTNAPFGFGHPYVGYNQTLDRFSEWLVSQRAVGWEVADLHSGMNRWLADERKADPNFSFSKDGVHPDAAGHWAMAKPILLYLGAKDVENANSASAMVAGNPNGEKILQLAHEQEQVLRDAWLNFCGFKRPGVKAGLPVPEAEAKAAELDKQIRELAKLHSATNS